MSRGKDLKPRAVRTLKEPAVCPKHGILQVRRNSSKSAPRGDLRCRACYNEKAVSYRDADPERYAQTQRKMYIKNYAKRMWQGARSRAKAKSVPFQISVSDIIIPKKCPILGVSLYIGTGTKTDNSPSLDRIIPSQGYVPGNIQVISDRANRIKTDATLEEIDKVASYLRNL